ncbi:unnamed protein product [Amoebophrya sp. A120]|nr:unnamed protein product [Amoebophrya sp. A120]|eukprot:GSA120T00008229001.1
MFPNALAPAKHVLHPRERRVASAAGQDLRLSRSRISSNRPEAERPGGDANKHTEEHHLQFSRDRSSFFARHAHHSGLTMFASLNPLKVHAVREVEQVSFLVRVDAAHEKMSLNTMLDQQGVGDEEDDDEAPRNPSAKAFVAEGWIGFCLVNKFSRDDVEEKMNITSNSSTSCARPRRSSPAAEPHRLEDISVPVFVADLGAECWRWNTGENYSKPTTASEQASRNKRSQDKSRPSTKPSTFSKEPWSDYFEGAQKPGEDIDAGVSMRVGDILHLEIEVQTGVIAVFQNDEVLAVSRPEFIPAELLAAVKDQTLAVHAVFDLKHSLSDDLSLNTIVGRPLSLSYTDACLRSLKRENYTTGGQEGASQPDEDLHLASYFPKQFSELELRGFYDKGTFRGRYVQYSDDVQQPPISMFKSARRQRGFCGAIGDNPIPFYSSLKGLFFELRVDKVGPDAPEGLTLGVTTKSPDVLHDQDALFPAVISDEVFDPCWCVGFSGKLWHSGILQWNDFPQWHPGSEVRKGDRVGLLVVVEEVTVEELGTILQIQLPGGTTAGVRMEPTSSSFTFKNNQHVLEPGQLCLIVNRRIVAVVASNLPINRDFFPLVDLLGNCEAVTLVTGGLEDLFSASLQNVQDQTTASSRQDDQKLLEAAREDVLSQQKVKAQSSGNKRGSTTSVASKTWVLPLSRKLQIEQTVAVRYIGPPRSADSKLMKKKSSGAREDHELHQSAATNQRCHVMTYSPAAFDKKRNAVGFAVKVDEMMDDGFHLDGLTLGLVQESPQQYVKRSTIPATADLLENFTGTGFDGCSVCANGKWHDDAAQFHPAVDLKEGDIVAVFLATDSGTKFLSCEINGEEVLVRPASAEEEEEGEENQKAGTSKSKSKISSSSASSASKSILNATATPDYFGVAELRGAVTKISFLTLAQYEKEATKRSGGTNMNLKLSAVAKAKRAKEKADSRFRRLKHWGVQKDVVELLQARGMDIRAMDDQKRLSRTLSAAGRTVNNKEQPLLSDSDSVSNSHDEHADANSREVDLDDVLAEHAADKKPLSVLEQEDSGSSPSSRADRPSRQQAGLFYSEQGLLNDSEGIDDVDNAQPTSLSSASDDRKNPRGRAVDASEKLNRDRARPQDHSASSVSTSSSAFSPSSRSSSSSSASRLRSATRRHNDEQWEGRQAGPPRRPVNEKNRSHRTRTSSTDRNYVRNAYDLSHFLQFDEEIPPAGAAPVLGHPYGGGSRVTEPFYSPVAQEESSGRSPLRRRRNASGDQHLSAPGARKLKLLTSPYIEEPAGFAGREDERGREVDLDQEASFSSSWTVSEE